MNINYNDIVTNCALKNDFWNEQMIGHCKCKNCGKEADVDMSLVLTSYPPQYNYSCPHCGTHGYIFCSEAYVQNSHEDNQDSKIKELIEKISQLEVQLEDLKTQLKCETFRQHFLDFYRAEIGEEAFKKLFEAKKAKEDEHIDEEIEKVRNGDRD